MKNGAPRDELKNGRGRGWAGPYFPLGDSSPGFPSDVLGLALVEPQTCVGATLKVPLCEQALKNKGLKLCWALHRGIRIASPERFLTWKPACLEAQTARQVSKTPLFVKHVVACTQ